jgi:hypothetical protein
MKKNLLFLFLLISFCSVVAQSNINQQTKEKFTISKLGKIYTSDQLKKAVENADWCGYYNKSESYILKFDDGAEVELLSYSSLKLKGLWVDQSCVQEEFVSDNSIYSVHSSGIITKKVPKDSHVKTIENK